MPKPIHPKDFPALKHEQFTILRRDPGKQRFIYIAALESFDAAWNVGRASGGDLETIVVRHVENDEFRVWFSADQKDYQHINIDGEVTVDRHKPQPKSEPKPRPQVTTRVAPGEYVNHIDDSVLRQPSPAQITAMDHFAKTGRIRQTDARHERLLQVAAPILGDLCGAALTSRDGIDSSTVHNLAKTALDAAEALYIEWDSRKP